MRNRILLTTLTALCLAAPLLASGGPGQHWSTTGTPSGDNKTI